MNQKSNAKPIYVPLRDQLKLSKTQDDLSFSCGQPYVRNVLHKIQIPIETQKDVFKCCEMNTEVSDRNCQCFGNGKSNAHRNACVDMMEDLDAGK